MALSEWPPRLGSQIEADGFFGKLNWLINRSAAELESRIGYGAGRLTDGWWLLLLMEPIGQDDFIFAGHSHFSGGRIGNPLLGAARIQAHDDLQSILTPQGFAKQKQQTATGFSIIGPERVAKIVPRSIDDGEYPPGSGIPQWKLIRRKQFIVAADVPKGHGFLGGNSGFWMDTLTAHRFGHKT